MQCLKHTVDDSVPEHCDTYTVCVFNTLRNITLTETESAADSLDQVLNYVPFVQCLQL